MDGTLFSNPMVLMIMVLILFGGQIKLGDKTLLQFILDMLSGLFKPVPVTSPTPKEYGGTIIDMVKGLFSNPMVLIVLVMGVMMVTGGGGCGGAGGCTMPKTQAALPPDVTVTPTSYSPDQAPYTGSHYVDTARLELLRRGEVTPETWAPIVLCDGGQWQMPDAADLPPGLNPADVPLSACSASSCCRAANRSVGTATANRVGFWERGPVRRLVASRPLMRRWQPLRRVGRGLGWLFGRR